MTYQIKLLDLPEQPTLSLRATLPVERLPDFFAHVYGSIMDYLNELGETVAGMPYGAYYNMDMQALDIEAGFPVSKSLSPKGEIISGKINGGKFLSTIHEGSYDTLSAAYKALKQYAQEHGQSPSGIAYEYYLNDPREDPSGIALTEIRFPLN